MSIAAIAWRVIPSRPKLRVAATMRSQAPEGSVASVLIRTCSKPLIMELRYDARITASMIEGMLSVSP